MMLEQWVLRTSAELLRKYLNGDNQTPSSRREFTAARFLALRMIGAFDAATGGMTSANILELLP